VSLAPTLQFSRQLPITPPVSGMDPEDYRESVALFVTLAPDLARELKALTLAGDLAQLHMLAHRLVGTIGFFDAEASECARRLETAMMEGRLDDLPGLANSLEAELVALVHRLSRPDGDWMSANPEGART